jgi:hypothetical protein
MKLLFSEARPDYAHYVFPYAVWAFPEPGETAADLFEAGFLPSSHQLDRFYLCRHVRVALEKFQPSSENRRILRKGEGVVATLVPRADFVFTPARRAFCQRYIAAKFGAAGMEDRRLDSLFHAPITSHVLVFTEAATGAEAGLATLYIEEGRLVYYYYAFYDLTEAGRSLGMFMMTTAVQLCTERGVQRLYLGSCYTENALYKTQFLGCEFFNGHRWSESLAELRFLLRRHEQPGGTRHLLEDEAYRAGHLSGDLTALAAQSRFGGG